MDTAKKRALFEQMVIPHLNAAYNLSRWLTGNTEDAEDLVQQSCLKAFRSLESFHGDGVNDARSWLLAIVRNTCFTWLRKKGAQLLTAFDEQLHTPDDRMPDGETILLKGAALALLKGCIEGLPAEFREAIILRELEELSYKEISEIVRVPVGTVMSRLARARKRLQGCMEAAR